MTKTNQTPPRPLVFDPAAKMRADQRAQARQARHGTSFLLKRCIADVAERVQDVNRQMGRALLVGRFDLRDAILAELPADKRFTQFDFVTALEAPAQDYDLVLSLLELQGDEEVPERLVALRQALKPDGLLLAATLGGATLSELRQVLYGVDQARLGGATPRVWPMLDYSQAAALLGRAGLALPVVDADKFTVSYTKLKTLFADLRDLGLSNILAQRHPAPLTRSYLDSVEQSYSTHFAREDGKYLASFEILWLTGWAPHESQQKPLKPGSAKMRLADALGTTEQKL